MSCWVVPSLAAELWRIPLELIWMRIQAGEIPSRQENGFTFVDAAPFGPRIERPMLAPADRPPTFAAADPEAPVSDEELAALGSEKITELPAPAEDDIAAPFSDEAEPPAIAGAITDEPSADDEMGPEDPTASQELGDWRIARRRNARLRVPPLKWRLSA